MRTLATPNADEDVKQQKLSFTTGGNSNGTTTWEDNLAVSYKTKYMCTITPTNNTPQYWPKVLKFMSTEKIMTYIAALVIMVKLGKWHDVAHPGNGIWFSIKKTKTDKQMKNLDNPWKGMEETSMHIAK